MTKSKPNIFRMTLLWLGLLFPIGIFCILAIEWIWGGLGLNNTIQILLVVLAIVVGLVFILAEAPETHKLTIDHDKIALGNVLTRRTSEFELDKFDAFRILIFFSKTRGVCFELVFLLQQSTALEPISLSYMDNLDEIITELEKRLPNLTEDEYGVLKRTREQERSQREQVNRN